jgi:tellurite resistance protein
VLFNISLLNKQENEFKQSTASLYEEYKGLQNNFDDHNKTKEQEYKKLISSLKKNYDKEVEK